MYSLPANCIINYIICTTVRIFQLYSPLLPLFVQLIGNVCDDESSDRDALTEVGQDIFPIQFHFLPELGSALSLF